MRIRELPGWDDPDVIEQESPIIEVQDWDIPYDAPEGTDSYLAMEVHPTLVEVLEGDFSALADELRTLPGVLRVDEADPGIYGLSGVGLQAADVELFVEACLAPRLQGKAPPPTG